MSRKRKKPPAGAPAYMQLYTSLMILLLAFFILLNTMATKQEVGFRRGIGAVKNAFGLSGGLGLLAYDVFRRGRGNVIVPPDLRYPGGAPGTHRAVVEGAGGAGITDEDLRRNDAVEYVRLRAPFPFAAGSAVLPAELATYLRLAGTGLAMFGHGLFIRSYCGEAGDIGGDRHLAMQRAVAIMRYLHEASGVPYDHMEAVGYPYRRYFTGESGIAADAGSAQLTYFYVLRSRDGVTRPGAPGPVPAP